MVISLRIDENADLIKAFRVNEVFLNDLTTVFNGTIPMTGFNYRIEIPFPLLGRRAGAYRIEIVALNAAREAISDPVEVRHYFDPPPTAMATGTATPPPTPTLFIPTIVPLGDPNATPVVAMTATPSIFIPTVEPTFGAPTIAPPIGTDTPNAPNLLLGIGDQTFDPVAVRGCVIDAAGATTCTEGPLDAREPRAVIPVRSVGTFTFAETPSTVLISVFTGDGTTNQQTDRLAFGEQIQYVLPSLPGTYLLTVEIAWSGGTATYLFRLSVTP